MSVLNATVQQILDLLFPPRCVSCGAAGAVLCATCLASIRAPVPPLCRRCGRSLAASLPAQGDVLCSFCSIGRLLQRPVRTDLLVRSRATRAQMTLSAPERHINVAGAFVLTSPAARAALIGKRILLLDDVTTTGSTLDAAAAALREANPAAIWGLAAARPELHAEGQVESTSARPTITRARSTQR